MGRYKLGPQGGYYDPNDSGPDQFTPTPGQQYPGMPAPQQAPQGQPQQASWSQNIPDAGPGGMTGQMPQQPGGMDPNALPGTYHPWSESMPDGSGGSYNPGGHVDANGNPLPGPPPMDTSGWAHKQYPGGVGGPVPPWMTLGSLGGSGLGLKEGVLGGPPQGDLTGSKSIWSSLGSIGNTLGVNGGNVQPKTGMLGPIVNQFKR
jgi:hypothetical protein